MREVDTITSPDLSPEDLGRLGDFWRFYEPYASAINDEVLQSCQVLPEWKPILQSMSKEALSAQHQRSLELQRAALVDGAWMPYLGDLREQGTRYARSGTAFGSWFGVLSFFREAVRKRLVEVARSDLDAAFRINEGMNRFLDIGMAHLGDAYLTAKEQIIRDQQEAIREISTPVLQVRDQLLIIPIVGLVDTHRARLLTEGLLRGIRERRAKGVVMDITGVPVVDSKVANHLAQACEAARLMGAFVVMTGISAEIALTLVTIGAQLPGVRTVGDLQSGIEEIERLMDHREETERPSGRERDRRDRAER